MRALNILNGFVISSILGLTLFHAFPHGVEVLGWWTPLIFGAGLLLPTLLEQGVSKARQTSYKALIALIAAGLIIHMALDGLILSHLTDRPDGALQWAIILHQLPEGSALWWMLSQLRGQKWAAAGLFVSTLILIVGFFAGTLAHQILQPGPFWQVLEIFVAGALLHVLLHHAPDGRPRAHSHAVAHPHRPRFLRQTTALGAVLGLLLVATINHFELPDHSHNSPPPPHSHDHPHHHHPPAPQTSFSAHTYSP